MRAIYNPKLVFIDNIAEIDGEDFHHLLNVIRIKKTEKILVIKGNGIKTISKINEITKKKIIIEKIEEVLIKDKRKIDLLLANPKKEATFEIFKSAIETNIKNIYIAETRYSQRLNYNKEKINKILKSSYQQSNCYFDVNELALSH